MRRRSGVFIVNFEHILHIFSSVFIVVFKQVNVSWTVLNLLNTGFSVDLKEVSQLTAILVYMTLDKS